MVAYLGHYGICNCQLQYLSILDINSSSACTAIVSQDIMTIQSKLVVGKEYKLATAFMLYEQVHWTETQCIKAETLIVRLGMFNRTSSINKLT